MYECKDIVLSVDYHADNIEFRWLDLATGQERTGHLPTSSVGIRQLVRKARKELAPGGQVVWLMESTTGWARVKDLLDGQVRFLLTNVLRMPREPKAHRRKTDKIDTARQLREYLNGRLPTSFQPSAECRRLRRLVDMRQDLVERQTAIKNWIGSLLHHETWQDRQNLWSRVGRQRLAAMALSTSDRLLVDLKLQELDLLARHLQQIEAQMQAVCDRQADAQRLDQVHGVGMVTAVSLLAHIGPIERFANAEQLISYAGLAPGVQRSDKTSRNTSIGGGGTDSHLRYLLIEATTWLCRIPRYRAAYERVVGKRGRKIARIAVARMFLRSLHKMQRDQVPFHPGFVPPPGADPGPDRAGRQELGGSAPEPPASFPSCGQRPRPLRGRCEPVVAGR